MAEFDTLIKSGTIVDGTRVPRYSADLGVKDGKIKPLGVFFDPGPRRSLGNPRPGRERVPLRRPGRPGRRILRPIVQRGRIKIGAVGPNKCVRHRVDRDLVEYRDIAQGPVDLAG